MRNQDRIIATIIFSMLVVLWLGFLVHRSSFFAGSLLGGVFGVVGAAFMLVPLTYTVIKRSATLRRAFTRKHGFGAQYLQPTLLTVGHFPCQSVSALHQPHHFQPIKCAIQCVTFCPSIGRSIQHACNQIAVNLHMLGNQQIFHHRHFPE